jgi:hypothetical protein
MKKAPTSWKYALAIVTEKDGETHNNTLLNLTSTQVDKLLLPRPDLVNRLLTMKRVRQSEIAMPLSRSTMLMVWPF